MAVRARNHDTNSNLCLISCSALRQPAVMRVMVIITLVSLFNISGGARVFIQEYIDVHDTHGNL